MEQVPELRRGFAFMPAVFSGFELGLNPFAQGSGSFQPVQNTVLAIRDGNKTPIRMKCGGLILHVHLVPGFLS